MINEQEVLMRAEEKLANLRGLSQQVPAPQTETLRPMTASIQNDVPMPQDNPMLSRLQNSQPQMYRPQIEVGTPTESRRQFDMSLPLQEAQITGTYLPQPARQDINKLLDLKRMNESADRNINREQNTSEADQIRGRLSSYGIDPSLFGKDVGLNQARQNITQAGMPTLARQEFDYGKERDQVADERWEREFEEDMKRFGLNYAIDEYNAKTSRYSAETGRMQEGRIGDQQEIENMLRVWENTGVAPTGLESIGIQPGTPISNENDPQQALLELELERALQEEDELKRIEEATPSIQQKYGVDSATAGAIVSILESPTRESALSELETQKDRLKNIDIDTNTIKKAIEDHYPSAKKEGPTLWDRIVDKIKYPIVTGSDFKPGRFDQQNMSNLLLTGTAMSGVPTSWVNPLLELADRESSWNSKAKNPKSTAYGLFQLLDGTWKDYAEPGWDRDNPLHQTLAGIKYIQKRYGTPQNALAFWDKNNWY